MSAIPFCKFHGFGNDYIVMMRNSTHDLPLSKLAIEICHRNTGAGADGIAVWEKVGEGEAD